MCMHRFYVAPDEAAQPGYLPSYRNGSSPAIEGAVECKVDPIGYKDNVHDYANDVLLGRFLDTGKIARFQRRTGWVTVAMDPVRTGRQTAYGGVERRAVRAKGPT